jgi:hypothetical protein
MSCDTEQLSQDLEVSEFFGLQLDESIHVYDVSQLLVSIGMVFKDNSIKEELLKGIPLYGTTRSKDTILKLLR